MKRCRPLLGTYVEITVHDASERRRVEAAIDAAYAAVDEVNRLMSFHDRSSELSRINALAAGATMSVSPWTWQVLKLAQELHAVTGGRFECGVGARLVRWGMLPDHGHVTADSGSMTDLVLLANHGVQARRPVCLDLGGLAKGFAVDKAVEALTASGIMRGVVNAGGDLRVLGDAPQPIHVRDGSERRQPRYLGELAGGAMATSASYPAGQANPTGMDGVLVNPFSQRPIHGDTRYTVLAPTCAVADGLTKALAVEGHLAPDCLARYSALALVA